MFGRVAAGVGKRFQPGFRFFFGSDRDEVDRFFRLRFGRRIVL